MSENQEREFDRGIQLFNRKKYWDAHEAWEEIWKELGNGPEDDWEIILRGLIQVAAGLHGLSVGKLDGGVGNLLKGKSKLELCRGSFLGINLKVMASAVESYVDTPHQLSGYQIHRRPPQ